MTPLKCWFMYDCHLFDKIDLTQDDDLVLASVESLFEQDGCGTVFVRDVKDVTIKEFSLHGRPLEKTGPYSHRYGVTHEEVCAWLEKVRAHQEQEPFLEAG